MNEKINVLGVNIDSFTAKEAMKETIAFLESEPVSVIDVVSVDALMQMNDLPELKEKMNEFDMILPGEKLILEAAEEPELPEEINMKLYLKMFMRYLHKNHKRLYLLVESEEEGQEAFRYLQKAYSGIQLVGLAKVNLKRPTKRTGPKWRNTFERVGGWESDTHQLTPQLLPISHLIFCFLFQLKM